VEEHGNSVIGDINWCVIGHAYSLTGRIQDIGVIMETRTVFSTKSKIKLRQPMEIAHDKVPFE
jgi:hypothetical protein